MEEPGMRESWMEEGEEEEGDVEEPGYSSTQVTSVIPGPMDISTALRRLHRELRDITNDPPPMCSEGTVDDDMFTWKGTITGPANSPYKGGIFYLNIQFPPNYHFGSPQISFTTTIYHPNINRRGHICQEMFRSQGSPIMTISKLLLSISSTLCDPIPNDAFVPSIASMYLKDRDTYDTTARAWTKKYAM